MGISAVLLAYKEAENLKLLLPQINEQLQKIGESYEIIVVDTEKALDETPAVCLRYGARYVNQTESGFGGAFRTGIRAASMDKFLILDSDGSHNPAYIPQLYRALEGADVVIGSRYAEGGETNDARSSVVMSKILNTSFRVCLGIDAKDISTDYRIYRTAQLKKLHLTCKNYDVLQEVLLKLRLNKPDLLIREVPITFRERLFGESKRRLIPFIASYAKTLTKLTVMRFRAPRSNG